MVPRTRAVAPSRPVSSSVGARRKCLRLNFGVDDGAKTLPCGGELSDENNRLEELGPQR